VPSIESTLEGLTEKVRSRRSEMDPARLETAIGHHEPSPLCRPQAAYEKSLQASRDRSSSSDSSQECYNGFLTVHEPSVEVIFPPTLSNTIKATSTNRRRSWRSFESGTNYLCKILIGRLIRMSIDGKKCGFFEWDTWIGIDYGNTSFANSANI
jgi:hypothetical protein